MSKFDFVNAQARLDALFKEPNMLFEKKRKLSAPDNLNYQNAHYAECFVICVDIRDSSKLHEIYEPQILTRIFRGYISELVAVMRKHSLYRYVRIDGDAVLGVFHAHLPNSHDEVVRIAAECSARVHILNETLAKYNLPPIRVGIGVACGTVIMVKAGLKGSDVSDTVWLGEPVNRAAKLSGIGNKDGALEMALSGTFYQGLSAASQAHFQPLHAADCYIGAVHPTAFIEHNKTIAPFKAPPAAKPAEPFLKTRSPDFQRRLAEALGATPTYHNLTLANLLWPPKG